MWIGLMSSVLKMDVSVFLMESILAEFQLNLQKKIVCRKLLCSQAGNYSWKELFSWPYFRPTSLKIFKLLISEQLWNPIDFIVTHKENSVEFFIWHHRERQANRINISHVEQHTDDCIPIWAMMIMIHLPYLHVMAVMEATAQTPSYLWAFRNQSLFSLQPLELLFPKI